MPVSNTKRLTSEETGQFQFTKDFVLLTQTSASVIMSLEKLVHQISSKISAEIMHLHSKTYRTVLSQTRPVSEVGSKCAMKYPRTINPNG